MFVFMLFFVFIAAIVFCSCFVSRNNTKVKNYGEEEVNKKSRSPEKTVPKEISTEKQKQHNTDQVIVAMTTTKSCIILCCGHYRSL